MATQLDQAQLTPDADAPGAPRISGMSEVGYTGLKITGKQITEETDKNWRMPQRLKTVEEMRKDAAISAALQFFRMMIGKANWTVKPPNGATEQQKERAKFIQSCMDDMDGQSWFQFITSVLTALEYGFSTNEKVYKRRLKGKSKYDDGLIGWKKLPSRSQSTLYGWVYSEDGRELLGMEQSLQNILYSERFVNLIANNDSVIRIPREKFMLFSVGAQNENPEGTPILKAVYKAWRYKCSIEDQETIGVNRDLGGLLHMGMPAAYLDPNADAGKKAVADEFKKVLRNVSKGEQSGILLPTDKDPDTKGDLFTVELLTSQGGKSYDTSEIINRYTSQIMICLFADLLQLGNNSTGSFALADGKKSLVESAIEYRLKEIRDVLNSDLIPQTFKMNGWSDTDLPTFEIDGVAEIDLESFSKAVQRIVAVSGIEKDRAFYNATRVALGLEPFPADEPVHEDELSAGDSRAGDGMSEGLNSGTGKAVTEENTSDNNVENK